MADAPLGQVFFDFVIQYVANGAMSCGSFIDDSLQAARTILWPQDANHRARPWMTKDLITQYLVLFDAIMDRHTETE